MQYLKTTSNGKFAVTVVFTTGKAPATVTEMNPNFTVLMDYLVATPENEHDEAYVSGLIHAAQLVGEKLTALSERVSVTESDVFFDGDPLEAPEADHLLRLIREGKKVNPLVAFLEKVRQNENKDSQSSLYNYLTKWNFTITNDGDIIAYKGIRSDGKSIRTGTAFVDGERVEGNIPNNVGSIITMPRSQVDADSDVGCAPGLHAGTYDYAKGWSQGKLLTVKINPRDVVSVPVDHDFQKIRTCRYEVLSEAEVEYTEAVWVDEDDDDYDDYDDYDDDEEEDYDEEEDEQEEDDDEEEGERNQDNELDNIDPLEDVVQVVNPATDHNIPLTGNPTLDAINSTLNNEGYHLAFVYTKTDGTVKNVNGFIPQDVTAGKNGDIVRGKNSDDEYRTYKISNMSDVNSYLINPPADVDDEEPEIEPQDADGITLTPSWKASRKNN